MHPDLLNNPVFIRYYRQWQEDPSSIVFAPISELLLAHGMVDDAHRVCREGIKRHPDLVTGRIVMAKIHLRRGNWEEAEEELRAALSVRPDNPAAKSLMDEVRAMRGHARGRAFVPLEERPREESPEGASWQTVTMARIYAAQGHKDRARSIYEAILRSDPSNEAARRGLEALARQ